MAKIKVHKPYPRAGCPHCGGVPRTKKFHDGANTCPICGKVFDAMIFSLPAEIIYVKPAEQGALEFDGRANAPAAPCAKHELNASVGNCERCGNFVCALCQTPLNGQNFCTSCFERLLEEGQAGIPPARERFHAGIACLLALVGFTPFLGLFFGPATIFYGVKGMRQAWHEKMQNVVKFTALFALLIGIIETLLNWGGMGYVIYLAIVASKW